MGLRTGGRRAKSLKNRVKSSKIELRFREIRPFTIGRKNFVMIESSNGAKASAILYSLVETAKANRINTFEYFNLLLTEIPQHMDDRDLRFIDDLLPWSPRVQKECPSRYKKS